MKLKRKEIIILTLFILVIFFIIIVFKYLNVEDSKSPIYKMAYISRNDNLAFISEGIKQASKDMNVEVEIYKIIEENRVEEQSKLLEKCINDKIDAIIISPIDYKEVSKVLNKYSYDGTIILMDYEVEIKKNVSYISCNNYDMGRSLAEEIVQRGNTRGEIAIVGYYGEDTNLEKINIGFIEEIRNTKNRYNYLKVNKDKNYSEILKHIRENEVDVVVTFNSEILEDIAKIKKNLHESDKGNNSNFEIYGVGISNRILSYVEEDIIDAVVVQNEFNLGYLSVEMAVNKLKNKKIEKKDIDFSIVNKRNMYSERNEKLLFPFVK